MALGNLSGDPAMAGVALLLCILGAAIDFVAKIRPLVACLGAVTLRSIVAPRAHAITIEAVRYE